jgi:hypothetical protein
VTPRLSSCTSQVVAAKLWHDEAQRQAFIIFVTLQPTPGYERTDDEHRYAPHFGQLVHTPGCVFLSGGECSDECVIVGCSEELATVVLIRVEVNVRKVDDE